MKAIDKIDDILATVVFNNSLLMFTNNRASDNGIFVNTLYHYKCYENFLLYQTSKFSNLVVLQKNGKLTDIEGEFNLSSATETKNSIIIANKKTRTYNSLNKDTFEVIDNDIYFKANHSISNFRYDTIGSLVSLYNALDGTKLWEFDVKDKGNALVWNTEQKQEVEEENTIAGDLLNCNDEIAIIPLNGGQLLAVEMATGKELWILEEPKSGRPVIYKDKIYAQSYPNIIEINARNGEILRSIDLTNVRQKYNFDLTGQLEVFEDFLFAFSPDGKIAMIDRERFSIVDFIEFEGTIPNNHGHLIWHDKKLYVHIWGDALLVFEKE